MACVLSAGAHGLPVGLVEMSYFGSGLCLTFTKRLQRGDLYLMFWLFLSLRALLLAFPFVVKGAALEIYFCVRSVRFLLECKS